MKRKHDIKGKAHYVWIVLIVFSLGLLSCTKPIPVAFNNACQKENNNVYISVEGYLSTGTSVLCSSRDGTRTCGLELADSPNGTNKISIYLEEGTGKNQMEPLPKSYSKENLKIRDRDGQVHSAQDRVRVIGIAKSGNDVVNSSYAVCYINVQEIERP